MKTFLTAPLCLGLWLSLGDVASQTTSPLPLQTKKLQLAQKLYREGLATHDSLKLAEGCYEYGKLHVAATDYPAAKRWFLKTLRILEVRGASYELARVHVRLSDLAYLLAQADEAFHHAYLALAAARRAKSNRGLIRTYSVLARTHGRDWAAEAQPAMHWPRSHPDSALYYFRKVEYLAYRLNDPMEVAHVKQDIGSQLIYRNDPRALVYLTEALRITTQQKNSDRYGMLVSLARAYVTFGQPAKAWPYLKQAKKLADRDFPNVSQVQNSVENAFVHFYQTTGNWKQGAIHAEKLHQWDRRALLADRQGALARLSVEFETEKKDTQLAAQQKELLLRADNLRLQQRYGWVSSGLLLFVLVVCGVFFWLFQKNQRLSVRNAGLLREQNHRVKNNLQVVSSLLSLQTRHLADPAARKAVAESQLRIGAMAVLHQHLYDGAELATVDGAEYLTELVGTVLRACGYGYVEPTLNLEPIPLSADQAVPLGLLLNELITNACKYAFPDHPAPVFRVSLCQVARRIYLTVSDNGPGLNGSTGAPERRSFGMRLIRMQADQLRASYSFVSEGGTRFSLEFSV